MNDITSRQLARLHDLAREHASELRAQALDAGWQMGLAAASRAARAATRFARSLARHRRLRMIEA